MKENDGKLWVGGFWSHSLRRKKLIEVEKVINVFFSNDLDEAAAGLTLMRRR